MVINLKKKLVSGYEKFLFQVCRDYWNKMQAFNKFNNHVELNIVQQ